MRYKIFKDGELINTIIADEAFCAAYCEKRGYTFEEEIAEAQENYAAQIEELKAELAATDYKIIKCSEAQMAGDEAPYDIAAVHAERQAIRDKINELEVKANGGT